MIILASKSPRRRQLLSMMGLDFIVQTADIDETMDKSQTPAHEVAAVSARKAAKIAAMHPDDVIVSADTIVVIDGKILGKPKDEADAIHMISSFQGKIHQVYTGVTLVFCGKPGENPSEQWKTITFAEKTDVHVCPMTMEQIKAYVRTGESMDKAGAYGIQGRFAVWVEGIRGDYNNVVGLPLGRVCRTLLENIATQERHQENL